MSTPAPRTIFTSTDLVQAALKKSHPQYEFSVFSKETAGDLNATIALKSFTSKNLWTE
ncbi:porphobilinogen deaminase [Penicillium rubens]|nr:porphobilinogen deaminase [Penicillium rubens]